MWIALIKQYWQVSLLKETPENTPYSPLLLMGIAVFFFCLVSIQWIMVDVEQQFSLSRTLLASLSLIASYALFTYALLAILHMSNRIIQTLTCLLAGHVIIHLLAFPLLLIVPFLVTGAIPQPLKIMVGSAYLIAILFLTVWQFMLTAYIYKQALSINYPRAVLASIGLVAANILIVSFWR